MKAEGHLVEGLEFHYTYFKSKNESTPNDSPTTTIASPNVRLMGNVAVIAYIRLVQRKISGQWKTFASEETRVWECRKGRWVLFESWLDSPADHGPLPSVSSKMILADSQSTGHPMELKDEKIQSMIIFHQTSKTFLLISTDHSNWGLTRVWEPK